MARYECERPRLMCVCVCMWRSTSCPSTFSLFSATTLSVATEQGSWQPVSLDRFDCCQQRRGKDTSFLFLSFLPSVYSYQPHLNIFWLQQFFDVLWIRESLYCVHIKVDIILRRPGSQVRDIWWIDGVFDDVYILNLPNVRMSTYRRIVETWNVENLWNLIRLSSSYLFHYGS